MYRLFSYTFLLRAIGMGLGFVSSFLVARLLGASSYGGYTLLFTYVALIAECCNLGTELLLVKWLPAYLKEQIGYAKGIIRASLAAILTTVGLVCGLLGMAMLFYPKWSELFFDQFLSSKYLAISFLLGTIMLAMRLGTESSLRGANKVIASQIGDSIIKQVCFLLFLGIFLVANSTISIPQMALLNTASIAISLVVMLWIGGKLWASLPAVPYQYDLKAWIPQSFAFWGQQMVSLLNIKCSLLLVGWLLLPADIALFDTAAKLADLLKLPLIIVNISLAPLLARLYAESNTDEIQQIGTATARQTTVIGLFIFALLALFGKPLLRIWGSEFEAAYPLLLTLCSAQVVNLACGSVAILLNIIGLHRIVFYVLCLTTVLHIALSAVAIYYLGALGAAIAGGLSIVFWNIALSLVLRKRSAIKIHI